MLFLNYYHFSGIIIGAKTKEIDLSHIIQIRIQAGFCPGIATDITKTVATAEFVAISIFFCYYVLSNTHSFITATQKGKAIQPCLFFS